MKEKNVIYIGSGYVWAVNLKTGIHDWMHGEIKGEVNTEEQLQLFRKKYPKAQIIELHPDLFPSLFTKIVKLTKENKRLKEKQMCLNLPFVKDLVEKLKIPPQEIINENKYMSVRWQ